jgi:hypothetical protein
MIRTILLALLGLIVIAAPAAAFDPFSPVLARPKDPAGALKGIPGAPGNWSRAGCGAICTITYSPGGRIDLFHKQLEIARHDQIKVVIDGPCISACTVFAEKMRPNVCITRRAQFEFHNATVVVKNRIGEVTDTYREDPSELYSADILAWVNGNGGFPGSDTSPEESAKFLVMYFDNARRYFKVCK